MLVNGRQSTWADVLSGIADNTKLFRNITSEEDRHKIQTDRDMIVKWSEDWQLGFNEGKCKVLHLESRNPKHDYHMKAVTLAVATEESDLGVII